MRCRNPHRCRRDKRQLSKKRNTQYDYWLISELNIVDPQLIFCFQQSLDKSPDNPGTSVSTKIAGTWTMLRELKSGIVPNIGTRSFEEQEKKICV